MKNKQKIKLLEAIKNNELFNIELKNKDTNLLIGFVEYGLTNYSKLNSENYYYWWFESENNPNNRDFNADLNCFYLTKKGEKYLELLKESLAEHPNLIDIANCLLEIETLVKYELPISLASLDAQVYYKEYLQLKNCHQKQQIELF